MFAEIRSHLAKAAEIDDSRQACLLSCLCETGCQLSIALSVGSSGGCHRVHEVERRLAAFECGGHGRSLGQFAGDDLDVGVMPPRAGIEFPRFPYQTADSIARLQQGRHQAAADVSRCSGDTNHFGSDGRRVDGNVHNRPGG